MFLSEWREFPSAPWGAGKSLARTGRKQANVSVRMAWNFLRRLALQEKNLDYSSRLDVVENCARPWHTSEVVSFLVGLRTYQHLGTKNNLRMKLALFTRLYRDARSTKHKIHFLIKSPKRSLSWARSIQSISSHRISVRHWINAHTCEVTSERPVHRLELCVYFRSTKTGFRW